MSAQRARTDRPREERIPSELNRRVWIEEIEPSVDGGRFAAKVIAGDPVEVTAEIFADGHDHVAAVVRHRAAGGRAPFEEVAMEKVQGDTHRAVFSVEKLRPWEYTIEAWIDRFATWQSALGKKARAGQDVASELMEGAQMLEAAAERGEGEDQKALRAAARRLRSRAPQEDRVLTGVGRELHRLMLRWADRGPVTVVDPPRRLDVARPRAREGAWYELFPRSCGEGGHGTFADAERELPRIARLGFDVLYLPPIHPIGRTHRKGPNNSLEARPEDPGSPWAIGAAEGGHTEVHSDLGTLDDFDRFHAACRRHGLELALDIAFQCSPDHPWVQEHPQWFRHRPDGTIKYAENPPKKYQDIYPLDFESEDWEALWKALRDVFLFWSERGVRIFRVDNPHTKPIRFWEWCIEAVKRAHPESVFLSEAFTRPNVKYALAKAGFDQSYTYFTWRNTKHELESYLTELTRSEVRHFLRPNFFANTPDILPEFLQMDGRPAFLQRLVLAATLSPSYGIYSGFELCENEALPGSEEYADSEKYQLRPRDFQRPGNLNAFLGRINTIRRENPALLRNDTLRFHPTDNEQIIFYSKTAPDLSNVLLVVVNLDPHHVQHGWVEVPLGELGLREDESYQMHELLGDGRFLWQGRRNYVRLDPQESPAQIFRVRRRVRTEHDFDYYL